MHVIECTLALWALKTTNPAALERPIARAMRTGLLIKAEPMGDVASLTAMQTICQLTTLTVCPPENAMDQTLHLLPLHDFEPQRHLSNITRRGITHQGVSTG